MATYETAERLFFSVGGLSTRGGRVRNSVEYDIVNLRDSSEKSKQNADRKGYTDGLRPCSPKKAESMLHLPSLNSKSTKENRLYMSTPSLRSKQPRRELSQDTAFGAPHPEASVPQGGAFYFSSGSAALPSLKDLERNMDSDDVTNTVTEEPEPEVEPEVTDEDRKRTAILEAEEDVRHNWVLDEELKESERRFKRRQYILTVDVPDEDPLVAIEKRLDEIREMARPRPGEDTVLEKVEADKREYILKLAALSTSEFCALRRKGWRLIDKFRWAARVVRLLVCCLSGRRKYSTEQSDVGQLRRKMQNQSGQAALLSQFSRSSVGLEMQLCLITRPHLRDPHSIKKVMWLLRATKAFQHLFPAEMARELARYVSYEKYDDNRTIANQGRPPDRFYYIIAGRMRRLKQIKLSTGQVTKAMGFLTKGMTTDPEEMEKSWLREDSLVAKGQVEVLVLDKKAYCSLQHTTQGPPVDFIRSLDLFEEFPVDSFLQHADAIEYKYYGQGKTIVRDSNRTQWLHVVKSGQVKVVRRQSVIDTRLSNEHKFSSASTDKLGTGKYFSHASTMLQGLVKQRKGTAANQFILPEILKNSRAGNGLLSKSSSEESLTEPPITSQKTTRNGVTSPKYLRSPKVPINENLPRLGVNSPHLASIGIHQTAPLIYRNSAGLRYDAIPESEEESLVDADAASDIGSENVLVLPAITKRHLVEDDASSRASSTAPSVSAKRRMTGTAPVVNIPMREAASDDFKPHSLWLTREKTDAEGLFTTDRKDRDEHRRAYLQMDTLNPGDVFGLDHMQPALASEPRGVGLLSDGAEIIKISKRFFLQYAANNTMLKVETMYKEYMSEEEARDTLYNQETWKQYKTALWQRLVAPRPPVTAR